MTIAELVKNKKELIRLKKAEIKQVKGGLSGVKNQKTALKGLYKNDENELERTIIGNTYLWMDSHNDVHAKNCFSKSIKERKEEIFHLHDHEFKLTSKVGEPLDIYEKEITWKDLNVDRADNTQALMMDSKIIKDYNAQIFNGYKEDKINQHSVGMVYVKLDLAVNEEDYEEEYKIWLEFIDQIGNKEKAEEKGYFWVVREAKLIEISAVLLGSNELTPTITDVKNIKVEAEHITPTETEAEKSLQKRKEFLLNN